MGREFELRKEIELEATPEQVWEAIATGPGLTSWLFGPYEVEPGVGGKMKLEVGDVTEESTITGWDPPKRLAVEGERAEDGTFQAFEYLIEARGGGTTVLRFVHSGFLSDDWSEEYIDQTSHGWDMYFHTLAEYLKHFAGRTATYVVAQGPTPAEGQDAWGALLEGLGVTEPVEKGDRVRLTPEGLDPIEGVVDYAVPGFREFLGVRGSDGLYRFHGGGPQIAVGHHVFTDVDAQEAGKAWTDWLNRVIPQAA